jgi:hypothetical protein
MRTYGRVKDTTSGQLKWVEVTTDKAGFNDYVYLTTLIQTLLLNRGESPFYANYGIPAQQAVAQQVFPDFYMAQTQQQFSTFFASLVLTKLDSPTPTYKIDVTTNFGVKANEYVPIPG